MNPKIRKLQLEREKISEKIKKLEAQNLELEKKITELENTEIVGAVRETEMTLEEFLTFLSGRNQPPVKEEIADASD